MGQNRKPEPGEVVIFREGDKQYNAIVLRAHVDPEGNDLLHLLMARPEVSEKFIGTSRAPEAIRIEYDVPAERWKPINPEATPISACVAGEPPATEKEK